MSLRDDIARRLQTASFRAQRRRQILALTYKIPDIDRGDTTHFISVLKQGL